MKLSFLLREPIVFFISLIIFFLIIWYLTKHNANSNSIDDLKKKISFKKKIFYVYTTLFFRLILFSLSVVTIIAFIKYIYSFVDDVYFKKIAIIDQNFALAIIIGSAIIVLFLFAVLMHGLNLLTSEIKNEIFETKDYIINHG